MDIRLRYPKKYIAAHDLQGHDVTLTIRSIVSEALKLSGGAEETRPVLFFEETKAKAEKAGTEEKRLVLNITNRDTIAEVYGTYEEEDWIGKRITLFPTTTQLKRKTVECVRVRPNKPAEKKENV